MKITGSAIIITLGGHGRSRRKDEKKGGEGYKRRADVSSGPTGALAGVDRSIVVGWQTQWLVVKTINCR